MTRFVLQQAAAFCLLCFMAAWFIAISPDRAAADSSQGSYPKDLTVLMRLFRDDPANPELNYFLGRTAFELGDYEAALMAFDRVLIATPGAYAVKLEIARCYLALGAYEVAGAILAEIMAADSSPRLQERAADYLAVIEGQRGK